MEESTVDTYNQQERFLSLAWLAGLFEGEGSVSLVMGSGNRVMPRVHIINTDYALIEEWVSGWKTLGVGSYVQTRKVYNPEKHKQTKQVIIAGVKRVQNFCQHILPFVKGRKKEVVAIVLEYCTYRLSLGHPKRGMGYSSKDFDYVNRVRALNKKGPEKSPETVRWQLGKLNFHPSQDIVQT